MRLLAVALAAVLMVPPGAAPASASADGTAGRVPASLNAGVGVPTGTMAAAASAAATVCAKVAAKAGFSYTANVSTSAGNVRQIVVAVAVAMAESSCNPSATGQNPGSIDRGLWQINNYWHPEVSDACAYQVQCNANAAWNISNHGSNWTPWSTYNNGAWRNYLNTARDAITGFSFQLKSRGAGTCLDAISSDVRNGGRIAQWPCNSSDSYQQWRVVVGANNYNPVLQNVGTGTCLDAISSDIRNGGAITQWACNTTGDPYQRWWFSGSGQLNTNGDANAGLHNVGTGTCLDADASTVGQNGNIFQWACSGSDLFQLWN
ncbi:RICIN domain-containing protein [Micromonospora sp. NPDC006431]|uniref:RICIN domain-containing protein n=1 Tax=Micromonospora sp. NPDC006431 TaxID=3364235 RepID=UPI0036B46213